MYSLVDVGISLHLIQVFDICCLKGFKLCIFLYMCLIHIYGYFIIFSVYLWRYISYWLSSARKQACAHARKNARAHHCKLTQRAHTHSRMHSRTHDQPPSRMHVCTWTVPLPTRPSGALFLAASFFSRVIRSATCATYHCPFPCWSDVSVSPVGQMHLSYNACTAAIQQVFYSILLSFKHCPIGHLCPHVPVKLLLRCHCYLVGTRVDERADVYRLVLHDIMHSMSNEVNYFFYMGFVKSCYTMHKNKLIRTGFLLLRFPWTPHARSVGQARP